MGTIDHFHKWRPIINSFVSIKISLTDLILKLIILPKLAAIYERGLYPHCIFITSLHKTKLWEES